MNALKHGFRSERVAEEVVSSSALEQRRRTWLAQCDAQTDMDEFLITSNVVLSFNLERVWRAAAACLDREKESADDKAIEQVQELASRLYFDPTGPTSKYGLEMVVFDVAGASTSGATDDAYQPAKLVNQLEATAVGCTWLLHEWKLLRDRAVNGLWYSLDRLKAIRLLGCQPVDAIDQWQVAMIYVASNGLMRLGENGFEDLGSDMSKVALERLLLRVKARFRDLFFEWTEADYRQMLIDLVDESVEPLQAKLEWHKKQNARCGGDRKADELGFDDSPGGARMRQYELRCKSSLERGVARFNKLAQDRVKGAAKRVAGRGGSGAEGVETYGRRNGGDPRGARDPRRTSGRGGEQPRVGDACRARAQEWERVEQKLDASDIRACGGFLPLGRTGLASGTLTERSAGAADVVEGDTACGETSVSADPSAACGTSPAIGGESFTNEPELHEDVIYSQTQESVEVAADSGVDSGLDKVADLLGAGGREHEADVEYPEFDVGLMPGVSCQLSVISCRELLPATGEDVPRLAAGQTTRSVGEDVPTRSVATRRVETPRSGCEGSVSADAATADCGESASASEEAEEAELRELQAKLAIETVKRQARAGPMAEAIRDLMASSPEAMEVLKPFLPRAP